jgi:hypothetical protein
MKTETKLAKLKAAAVTGVDPSKLKDIRDVEINHELPVEERIRDFIKQIGNPYIYRCNGHTVRVSFAGSESIEECLGHALATPYRH